MITVSGNSDNTGSIKGSSPSTRARSLPVPRGNTAFVANDSSSGDDKIITIITTITTITTVTTKMRITTITT